MTTENDGLDRPLEDGVFVDALLAECGFPAGSADDDGLRDTLLRLRSLRGTEVPTPSAELQALMGGTDLRGSGMLWTDLSEPEVSGMEFAGVTPLAGWSKKRPGKKRAVFTTLAVAASLGVAGGAAAGNETVRRHAEGTIDTIIRSFSPPAPAPAQAPAPAPPGPAYLAPARPADAPHPAPAVAPSPKADLQPVSPGDTRGHLDTTARQQAPGRKQQAPSEATLPPDPAPTHRRAQTDGTARITTDGTDRPGTDQPRTPPTEAVPPAEPEGSMDSDGTKGLPVSGSHDVHAPGPARGQTR